MPISELTRPRWPDQTFQFGSPPWMLADFTERLRGTIHRIALLLARVPDLLRMRELRRILAITPA